MTKALISAEELNGIIDAPDVRIVDASYGLPPSDMRIGKAADFDIDVVADMDSPFTHTLPTPELFAEAVGEMGIGNDTRVVVYDRDGMAMAASRVWWMFRVFGHDKVMVLDGGMPAWLNAGYLLQEVSDDLPQQTTYTPHYRPLLFKKQQDMVDNLDSKTFTVVDARDARRYSGEAPEPRPGIESGHIPGAVNVPFMTLIDPATGLFKSADALKAAVTPVDMSKPVAISCGSGVTACVVALALYQLGNDNAAVYGGSWTEWGGDPSLPKKKGNAP